MNWWLVFSAGLLAGATTCAATQGGLLVGLLTRQRKAAGQSVDRSWTADLFPTGGFLVGKLISHTLLGGLLGFIGTAFAINPKLSGLVQWLAGLLMIAFGLGSLNVPGFRDLKFAPPESWTGLVRKSTKSKSAVAPAMLGLATVLIPCGVTISMEILAATSGSMLMGAAVMALFVLGSAPMFAVFGVLAQRLIEKFNFLGYAMGAMVVVLGLWSINAGMTVLGSPISIAAITAGNATPSATATADGNTQVVRVNAENTDFAPDLVAVQAGVPTKLVLHTEGVWSCIRSIVVPSLGITAELPSDGDTEIDLGVLEPGDLAISCSMGMYHLTLRAS